MIKASFCLKGCFPFSLSYPNIVVAQEQCYFKTICLTVPWVRDVFTLGVPEEALRSDVYPTLGCITKGKEIVTMMNTCVRSVLITSCLAMPLVWLFASVSFLK